MIASNTRRPLAWALLAILTVPCPLALAQNDIEDPNTYPGSWYRIVLDTDGNYLRGDGHGYGEGTWYHYPETGWHRQWFYNQPFSTDRKGVLRYEVYIKAVDPNRRTYVEVRFNWATPEWHRLGLNRPPLPDDAPTATEEAAYMQSRRIYLVDNWFIGTIEPIATFTIEEYNPAWVSIDIRGRNAYVYRGAMHECQAQEGACCNPATEDCFLSLEEDCRAPYKWLGPGSTCDKCRLNASWMDFGDAPDDRYGTFEASDGARHTVVAGVCLGNIVDSELDAVPNATATGDDLREDHDEDGVAFLSSLSPGESATIEVTASTQGYLNAWSDFDQDGGFDGLGEQIFADELLARGLNTLSFKVPLSAETGATFARFRFNTRGLLSWNGPAADGEVEDYAVTITEHLEPQNNSGKGGLKWSQPPQPFDAATPYIFNGWDEPSALHLHRIAADDWRCEDDAPVTGIQWWGSFEGWTDPLLPPELPIAFHIALWTDSAEPNVAGPAKSGHPDVLIWETFCTNWAWSIAGYDSDPRATNDGTCFQFTHLLNQNQWFYPIPPAELNAGQTSTVYWLSIAAVYDTGALARHTWGWTTRPHSSEGGAVQITEADDVQTLSSSWPPGFGSQWLSSAPLEHPRGTPWDLAFELLTSHSSRGEDRALAPVYRFWSDKLQAHFYTISESEKNKLVDDATWTYEGIAFYAYPPGQQPAGAKPVYRFWSDKLGRHFYSISESEKEKLVQSSAEVWTFEGPAWYAFE